MALNICSVSKSYAETQVLAAVSLSIQPGEFLSLVGPSGCGKSTLLRTIAGLEQQDSGTVEIGGVHVDHLRPNERNVSMVFQNYALYPHMTVAQNVALPLKMRRMSWQQRLPLIGKWIPGHTQVRASIDREVLEICQSLQLQDLLTRKPAQLSGGQRQRVALARAMIRHPAVFLMDEPLSNLDAKLRVHLRNELVALHKRLGVTFVYVTHDQSEAMTMSDRIAVMDQGHILQIGTPQELYTKPANLKVAEFIGTPKINVFQLRAAAPSHFAWGHVELETTFPNQEALRLALRPEHLVMDPERLGDCGIQTAAHIARIEDHGSELLVHLTIHGYPDELFTSRVPMHDRRHALSANQALTVGFNLKHSLFFDAHGQRIEVD